jgi:endonuclease/exonuclease/phosphatase family metal-dependent hydrolase
MRHKQDPSDPSFRGVVLALVALVTVTVVLRSAFVDHHPSAAALAHRPPLSFSVTSERSTEDTGASQGRPGPPPLHLAPAPPPLERLVRTCIPDVRTGQLTVMSYNIHSAHPAYGGSKGLQLARIAQDVRLWGADVVLLQEVDVNRALSGHVDMPSWLATDLGWHEAFGDNVTRPHDSRYGTAILSRYPIRTESNTHLPNRHGMQQRGLLHVVIAPHGREISLYDTHLQNTSASMRLVQARAIGPIVARDPLPAILGGDFNSGPSSPVISTVRGVMADTWPEVGVGAGFTHSAWRPDVRIDYLFHRGDITPVRADVVNGGFSDHLAVRATFEYQYRHGQICRLH